MKVSEWCQEWGEIAHDFGPLSPQDKGKRVGGNSHDLETEPA